jgi:hypothetical protein
MRRPREISLLLAATEMAGCRAVLKCVVNRLDMRPLNDLGE